jgi:hypothetical protein
MTLNEQPSPTPGEMTSAQMHKKLSKKELSSLQKSLESLTAPDLKTCPVLSNSPERKDLLAENETTSSPGYYYHISPNDYNLDEIRIHATSIKHELSILCLMAYLVLQNAYGIRDIINIYLGQGLGCKRETLDIIISIAWVILLPCTVIAVLVSKALKIVEIPRKIASWKQKTLLQDIEKQIKTSIDEIVILISLEDFTKEIQPKADQKYGFYYTLHMLANRNKGTDFYLLVISDGNFNNITRYLSTLNKNNACKKILVLPYSKNYLRIYDGEKIRTSSTASAESSAKDDEGFNIRPPALNSPIFNYSIATPQYNTCISLSSEAVFFIFTSVFLGVIPVLVSVLQGGGTLTSAANVDEESAWSMQFGLNLLGAIIGLIRGWVTYKQKADDAAARFRMGFRSLPKIPKKIYTWLTNDLPELWPDSCVKARMRLIQMGYIVFGLYSAFGTVVFYAGLGFFFSNSGLTTWLKLSTLDRQLNQSILNSILLAASSLFCLGQVLLNAIGNQGPDVIWRYYQKAKGIDSSDSSTTPTQSPRSWGVFLLSTAIKLDGLNTGLSSATGALKIIAVFYPSTADKISVITFIASLSILIAVAVSQNTFAWTSSRKDEHLWQILYEDRYKPIVSCFGSLFTGRKEYQLITRSEDDLEANLVRI